MAGCFVGFSMFAAADPIKEEMKKAVLLDSTFSVQIKDSVMGDMFEIGKKLGAGAHGSVYSAVRTVDNQLVALKYMRKDIITNYFDKRRTTPMELHVHTLLKDVRGVIHILDVFSTSQSYVLVLETPSATVKNLHDYIRGKYVCMYEDEARYIMKQLLKTMRDVHKAGVYHQDVKPANILIEPKTSKIYVIDFGSAKLVSQAPYKSFCGTRVCTPKEMLTAGQCEAESATVWSLGITLYKMITRRFPYKFHFEMVQNQLDFSPYSLTTDVRDFISECLTDEPSKRPTISQLLKHPWMSSRSNDAE